jgi:hypothetical protein
VRFDSALTEEIEHGFAGITDAQITTVESRALK